MAKQTINIGSSVNKGDGDPLRTAFDKINDNFDELYGSADSQTLTLVGDTLTISNGNSVELTGLTQDFAFSSLTGTPTTLAGYGITDAFDVQGSVFADDSTLLVDGVNGEIPSQVISGFQTKDTDFTAEKGVKYIINTSNNAVNVTLPAGASVGDNLFFTDGAGNFATNNFTVLQSGYTIMGNASDLITNINNESFGLVYNGTTWRLF